VEQISEKLKDNVAKKDLRCLRIAGESKASLEETGESIANGYDSFVTHHLHRASLPPAATIMG
jgi:hypothetical protein